MVFRFEKPLFLVIPGDVLFGGWTVASGGAAHFDLLPLGLGDEQLPGLGALEGAHNALLLQLVHQPGARA